MRDNVAQRVLLLPVVNTRFTVGHTPPYVPSSHIPDSYEALDRPSAEGTAGLLFGD